MKVLLFGSKGYIGSEFLKQLSSNHLVEVITLPSRKSDGSHYSYRELEVRLTTANPDVVINAAAYVGGLSIVNCESNKGETINSNIRFPRLLGEICSQYGYVLGHLSSACVYNGYVEGGYKETDTRNLTFQSTCSFYTGTKAQAEDSLNDVEKKYIWRIRLPFDEENNERNYLSKIVKFERLITDSNSLSHRKELVNACITCILNQVPFGTYHVTNTGGIRADEIAMLMKRIWKIDKNFKYFADSIELDKISKIPRSNTIINNQKLEMVGIKMNHVYDAVEQSIINWKP